MTHDVALIDDGLPALVDRASQALAAARTSAEVLEAREMASFANDVAKRSARLAKAKDAHDSLVSAAHRAQADALEIEAAAKRRLADEYDAAQERGEVSKQGQHVDHVPDENMMTREGVGALGLSRKEIHEARQIRDAEQADPGVVRRALDDKIAAGEEPTRSAIKKAISPESRELNAGADRLPRPEAATDKIVNRTSFTGNNQWFTPEEHIERARRVLGVIDLDPASHDLAQEKVQATLHFTEQDDGLKQEWDGRVWLNPPYAQPAIGQFVEHLVSEVAAGRTTAAVMLTHNYTDTAWFQAAARAARSICFTRGRIRFVSPSGEIAAPTQGQAFFYFGEDHEAFSREFSEIGFVVEVCR